MRKGIKLGLDETFNIKLGSSQVSAVALGDQLIWQWDYDGVDYTYDGNTKQLTVEIRPTVKTLKRLQEGRLFLQLDYKDLQSRRTWFWTEKDCSTLRCRGRSRQYNVSGMTIPLTQLATTVDLSDIEAPFSYQSNRQMYVRELHKNITFVYIIPWIKFIPLNASEHGRHLPGSTGMPFKLSLVEENYVYGTVQYGTTTHTDWTHITTPGDYVRFNKVTTLPVGTTGIGLERLSVYASFSDEYGKAKTYRSCEVYWIAQSANFSTSILHDIYEEPIPSATPFQLVAYFPSGHMADLYTVEFNVDITTRKNA